MKHSESVIFVYSITSNPLLAKVSSIHFVKDVECSSFSCFLSFTVGGQT